MPEIVGSLQSRTMTSASAAASSEPSSDVAIGEAADGKSMPRQLATDNLAVVLVVFDEKDADGIRFALLVGRVRRFEN